MAAMAKWGNKKWKINSQQVVGIQNISFSYTQVDSTENSTDKKNKKKTSAKAKKKKEEKQKETESFFLVLRNSDPQRPGSSKCIR